MFRRICSIGAEALTLMSFTVWAGDAAITLSPGGSFVVKNATGDQSLLIVNSDGELRINGQRADFTPPTIEINAPEIATSYETSYTVTLRDDIELALGLEGSRKTWQYTTYLWVSLDGGPVSQTVMATDTSGNFSKKTFTVLPPETSLRGGRYRILDENVIPEGFNCSEYEIYGSNYYIIPYPQDFAIVDEGGVGTGGYTWSVAEGFLPSFWIQGGDDISGQFWVGGTALSAQPLQVTQFDVDSIVARGSGGGFSFEVGFQGQARAISGSEPQRIELDIAMKCNFNNEGWVTGTMGSYLAEFVEALP